MIPQRVQYILISITLSQPVAGHSAAATLVPYVKEARKEGEKKLKKEATDKYLEGKEAKNRDRK